MLASGVRWFDDWFAIEKLAAGVTAIGEPRFHQTNWNYLIEGQHAALLFDTGPGVRDISVVVKALTRLPVTAMPSHMHFDHTGNLNRFADIAMADLPVLRACESHGMFHATERLFLGSREGMVWNPVKVSRWVPVGQRIDLGGRSLEVIHTPGHSPDSISLFDRYANILFAADFVYPGPLYAQIPGADLGDYLAAATELAALIGSKTRLFCAHGAPDTEGRHRAPELHKSDISDLVDSLTKLRASGLRPDKWPINARMSLLAGEAAFASWQVP